MECLDANDVQDLMAGVLDAGGRTRVLGHLDTCEDCRELLSITASDVSKRSLPAFHDVGLEATATPESVRGDIALEATQASRAAIAIPVATQGTQLARFTLLDRLGAGAMGVVWRADDPKLGRHVALKVLKRADASLTERLVREARSMAQVNHPNVVTVYEVGEATDGTTFIAMELVTGTSLRAWQAAEKRTIPALVAAYIAAARGLAAAHAAGIVHRDFKPDNVLVGDDGRVRVTDFGLAAAKPTESGGRPHIGDVNLTTSGSVLGTPAYMAPEQFTGGNVDSRTDQFNFCVSLYEALYGERPFEGTTFAELGDSVVYGRIKDPPADARVSPALRAILVRGLSSKPGDRFATMNELITELGRDRARPWRWTTIGAAALAGALGLGLVADWAVRDRLSAEIDQSFALTGKQVQRAAAQLRDQFNDVSLLAYREPALREVAGHHDQAEFGLGTPEQDLVELERLHNTLASTDWVKLGTSTLAIGDYKGRLLYTSANPAHWGADLKTLPPVKRALDAGKGDTVTLVPYSDPAFAATKIVPAPQDGIAVLFVRSLALGDKTTDGSEARALYLQVQDAKDLLELIRLDDTTRLSLVAPSGDVVGDALDSSRSYQVQTLPIAGLEGQGTIAHVIMRRPLDGVLSLFPGARIVFALTAFASLVLATAAFLRARSITHGRV